MSKTILTTWQQLCHDCLDLCQHLVCLNYNKSLVLGLFLLTWNEKFCQIHIFITISKTDQLSHKVLKEQLCTSSCSHKQAEMKEYSCYLGGAFFEQTLEFGTLTEQRFSSLSTGSGHHVLSSSYGCMLKSTLCIQSFERFIHVTILTLNTRRIRIFKTLYGAVFHIFSHTLRMHSSVSCLHTCLSSHLSRVTYCSHATLLQGSSLYLTESLRAVRLQVGHRKL